MLELRRLLDLRYRAPQRLFIVLRRMQFMRRTRWRMFRVQRGRYRQLCRGPERLGRRGGVGGTVLPGPADMSQPPAPVPSTTIIPSAPVTLGTPALGADGRRSKPQPRPTPNSGESRRSLPSASRLPTEAWTDNRSFRLPAATEAGCTVEPPHVQGVPPVVDGPKLMAPAPAPLPDGSDRVTSLPVLARAISNSLPPPPATVPADGEPPEPPRRIFRQTTQVGSTSSGKRDH